MTAADKLASVKEVAPNAGVKLIQAWTDAANQNDFAEINLAKYGLTKVLNVLVSVHATEGSVITTEACTTAVTSGVLKVTFPASSDGKKRSILVVGQ